MPQPAFYPFGIFCLHQVECFRSDDCLMVAFHVVLRDLTLILFYFLLQKVHRETFLQQRVTLVLFVREYIVDRSGAPLVFAHRRFDSLLRKLLGNGVRCHSTEEHFKNRLHNLCLFGIDYNLPGFLILVQAQERTIGKADLAVRNPFALTPGDVFGN